MGGGPSQVLPLKKRRVGDGCESEGWMGWVVLTQDSSFSYDERAGGRHKMLSSLQEKFNTVSLPIINNWSLKL